MKLLALLVCLFAGCKMPGGVTAIPSVTYGRALDGSGDDYAAGGFTFVETYEPPADRPTREVVGYEAFPDPERGDSAPPDLELAAPLQPLSSGEWAWFPQGGPSWSPAVEADPAHPDHPGHEDPAIETQWGKISMTALLAILGTIGTALGIKKMRKTE